MTKWKELILEARKNLDEASEHLKNVIDNYPSIKKTYYVNVFRRTDNQDLYAIVDDINFKGNLVGDKHVQSIEFTVEE